MIKRNILMTASCILLCIVSLLFIQNSIYYGEAVENTPPVTILEDCEDPLLVPPFIRSVSKRDGSIPDIYLGESIELYYYEEKKPDPGPNHWDYVLKKKEEKERVFREFLSLHVDSGFTYYTKYHDAREDKVHGIKMSKDWQKFVYSCCKKYKIAK